MENVTETHIANPQQKPIRLQEYGVGIFSTLKTKSALKKALKNNLIYVDGKLGTTATYIYGNEKITFSKPIKASKHNPFHLTLEVLYEDDYLAIVHKPAGILVSGNSFKTVANALSENLKRSSQEDAVHPKPVHRLDYDTSGALLVGKTSSSVIKLNKLFENRLISKTYFAITIGKMKNSGQISSPVYDKEALTYFEVIETVTSERFQQMNLVKLYPKTGRRHQLRKHLSEIGNPILGDKTYGTEGFVLKGKGMYLHAFSLKFIHPITGEEILIEKELSSKFRKIFS